jgi:hypothetical protein
MKGVRIFLGLILFLGLIFSYSLTYAQQDPNDPGAPDSVFFTPDELYFPLPSGPGLAFIHINFVNDDTVAAISAPFIFSGPVVYDSVSFRDSRAKYLQYKPVNEDLLGDNKILVGAVPVEEDTLMGQGRGYFATLCFSVTDTGTVEVDTVFFPPVNQLTFVTTAPLGYRPVFVKGTFSIVGYKPGDADYDMDVDVSDVVYLINYLFKGGPAPYPLVAADVDGDCDRDISDVIYLINYLFKGGPPPQPGCFW